MLQTVGEANLPEFDAESVFDLTGAPTQRVFVIDGHYPAGAGTPVHSHPGDTIVRVETGCLKVAIGDRAPILCEQGRSFRVAAGTEHSFSNPSPTPTRTVTFFIVSQNAPFVERALVGVAL